MGSKSRTNTSTSTNVSNKENTLATADNRATESGNIGGNVTVGEAGGPVNITTTDYGAIDAAERVNMAALDFGSDSIEGMGDVSRDAIYSAQDVAESTIDLSDSAIAQSFGFGRAALSSNEYATDRAFEFGESALYEVSDTAAGAMGLAERSTGQAIDLTRENLYETNDTARELTTRALDFGYDTFDGALATVGESQAQALDFGGDALGAVQESNRTTIDTLADSFKFWNQQTSQNVDRSLAFADRANRSEGAAVLESGLKTVAIVGGVIGGTIVLREAFK